MRRPARQALLWLLLAAAGGIGITVAARGYDRLGEAWSLVIGFPSVAAIPFGLVYGLLAALAARGEARLRRGRGVIARWQVPAAEWEAFRAFAARRGTEGPGLRTDVEPRPAAGRSVTVLFGRRQVLVDDSYHPLRRFGLPDLVWVGWQQPGDGPEVLEFGVTYPAGESGGSVRTVVRVPVPRTARADGLRMHAHFTALAPKPRVGIAYRRPRLVLGWSLGVTALGAALAGGAWALHRRGATGDAVLVALLLGMMVALAGLVFAAIMGLVMLFGRKAGGADG